MEELLGQQRVRAHGPSRWPAVFTAPAWYTYFMSVFLAASRSFGQTILALGLCLMAFFFAMEAKTAWYGPAARPVTEVRASKALPDDAPKVVQHGIPASDPDFPQIPSAVLLAFATSCMAAAEVMLRRGAVFMYVPVSNTPCLTPNILFRPPPFC